MKKLFSGLLLLAAASSFAASDAKKTTEVKKIKQKKDIVKRGTLSPRLGSIYSSDIGLGRYFGIAASLDGSELIVNTPSINKDLAILLQKQYILQHDGKNFLDNNPIVQLSGNVEARLIHDGSLSSQENQIELTNAEFDISAWTMRAVTGYIKIAPNTDRWIPTNDISVNHWSLTDIVPLAFINVGDLDQSPVFFTAGQIYAPFGAFSTNFSTTSSLNKAMGRILTRALKLGYYNPKLCNNRGTLYVTAAIHNGPKMSDLKHFAGTVEYKHKIDKFSAKVYGSYTNHLEDAQGIASFLGQSSGDQVNGVDAGVKLGFGPFSGLFEYTAAVEKFGADSSTLNGKKPYAIAAEAAYDTNILDRPFEVAIGYSKSYQASDISSVEHQYGANLKWVLFRYLVLTGEYMRKHNYDSVGGQNYNVVSSNLDVYF